MHRNYTNAIEHCPWNRSADSIFISSVIIISERLDPQGQAH